MTKPIKASRHTQQLNDLLVMSQQIIRGLQRSVEHLLAELEGHKHDFNACADCSATRSIAVRTAQATEDPAIAQALRTLQRYEGEMGGLAGFEPGGDKLPPELIDQLGIATLNVERICFNCKKPFQTARGSSALACGDCAEVP